MPGPGSSGIQDAKGNPDPFPSTPVALLSALTGATHHYPQVPGKGPGTDLWSPTSQLSPSVSPGTALSQLSPPGCPVETGRSCRLAQCGGVLSAPSPLPVSIAHAPQPEICTGVRNPRLWDVLLGLELSIPNANQPIRPFATQEYVQKETGHKTATGARTALQGCWGGSRQVPSLALLLISHMMWDKSLDFQPLYLVL